MTGIKDIFDRETLTRLYERLEAFGSVKYGEAIYATETYQDCLQKAMMRVLRHPVAPKKSANEFFSYFCRAIDNCIRDGLRRVKRTAHFFVADPEKVSDAEALAGAYGNPERELKWAAERALMESWFPGDNEMHTYLELLTLRYKRCEIATEMSVEPRRVTDFRRRLKRRLARYLSEQDIHVRGALTNSEIHDERS